MVNVICTTKYNYTIHKIVNRGEYQVNKKHPFVNMGLIGLSITIVLNLFNQIVLDIGSGVWWSLWFPIYLVWLVFLVIGIGLSKKNKSNSGE